MRIDDYLSTVGVIKRRTVAKELATAGRILVGDRVVKASYQVNVNDIIQIKGKQAIAIQVLDLPSGSVSKESRTAYFKELTGI